MALAIVQNANGSQLSGTGVPSNVVLGSTPTVGNLVIAFLHTDTSTTGITIGTGWTQLANSITANTYVTNTYALYRYVQAGDTVSLPAMASAGTCHWAYVAYEVSGVSGVIGQDVQAVGSFSFINPCIFPAIIQQTAESGSTLALASGSNYTDNGTTSVPSGWTADLNTGAETNWGSLFGLSQANASAGSLLSGTSTHMAAAVQVILQTTAPTYPYARQQKTNTYFNTAANTLSPTLQTAPIPGNLVVALIETVNGAAAVNATGWSTGATNTDANGTGYLLYRYVQPGDTLALPQFFSASSDITVGFQCYELGGVTGAWASDYQGSKLGSSGSGTSFTTASQTTGENDTLALLGVGQALAGASSTPPSVGGAWTNFDGLMGSGAAFGSSQTVPASGTSVSATVTIPNSGVAVYVQALFGGSAPAPGGAGNFMILGVGK